MTMPMSPSQIQQLYSSKPDFAQAILDGEVHLKRFNSDPPRYELYWHKIGGNTPVSLDDVQELWSFATVQKSILDRWKMVIDDMKPRDWHDLITILINSMEEIDQPGASEAAQVLDILENWINRFITDRWLASELDANPIYKDDYYYLKPAVFETRGLFVSESPFFFQRSRMTRPKLCKILRNAGGEPLVKKFKGKKDGIWVWQIPWDFNKPPEPAQGELTPEEEEGEATKGEKGETQGELIPEVDVPEDF